MPSCCTLDAGRSLESPCPPLEVDGQRELEDVITLRKMATSSAAAAVDIQVVVAAVVVVAVLVIVVVVVAVLVVVNLVAVVVTVLTNVVHQFWPTACVDVDQRRAPILTNVVRQC